MTVTREQINNLYWKEGLSWAEVGKRLGLDGATCRYHAKKHGIPSRSWLAGHKWTREEERVLKENDPTMTAKEIAEKLGMPKTTVEGKRWRMHLHKDKCRIHPDFSPSFVMGYLVGAIKGDGGVYHTPQGSQYIVKLSTISVEFARSVKKAMAEVGLHPWMSFYDKKNQYIVGATSRRFFEWYDMLDAEELERFLSLNEQVARGFVRGFHEAEGCVSFSKRHYKGKVYKYPKVEIVNSSLSLLQVMRRAMEKFGFESSLYKLRKGKFEWWKLYLRGGEQVVHDFLRFFAPGIKNLDGR